MSAVCGVCSEPLSDAGALCHGDARRLALALRDVPELARELDVTITKRAKLAHRSGPGGTSEVDPVSLEFNENASARLSDLTAALRGWAVNLAEDNGHDGVIAPSLAPCALWLSERMAEVRMRDWAPDMHAEVMDAISAARRAIDAPPDLEFWGRCPWPSDEGGFCDEELWAPRGSDTVRCRACGAQQDTEAIKARAFRDNAHRRAPAKIIAGVLGIKTHRLYQWVHRGFLVPAGRDPRTNQDLYRLGDVRAVKDRMDRRTPKGVLGKKKGGKP